MDHWNVRMGKINEENTEEDISSYSKEHWYSFQNDIDNKSKHYFKLFSIPIYLILRKIRSSTFMIE